MFLHSDLGAVVLCELVNSVVSSQEGPWFSCFHVHPMSEWLFSRYSSFLSQSEKRACLG